jgi:protein TonB
MAPSVAQRPWPMPRGKTPAADLKLTYGKVLWISTGISVALHLIFFVIWPSFAADASQRRKDRVIIELEQIPETRQERKPPPPVRPAVPIATDSPDVPDDVTIETTELDMLELPPPPAFDFGEGEVELEEEEEIVEIWKVEKQPVPIVQVKPAYPDVARKAGIEGQVTVLVLVNKEGLVEAAGSITGNEIFHEVARAAALQWEFEPAIQNDKPVKVWVSLPFKFAFR